MESRRKVALITGANRGVGKGIALAFAEKGYDLFLAHYGEPEKAQEVIEEIQKRLDGKCILMTVIWLLLLRWRIYSVQR